MHMARDDHGGLIALDPLHQFDVAEITLAAPAGRGIRRRGMVHPYPSPGPPRGGLAQLHLDALPDQRSIPPRTDGKKRIAQGEAVAIAGNAKLARLADPA